jgi:ribosomal-protein-alanine N-acetyltransferase
MWTPSPLLTPVADRQEHYDQVFLAARRQLLALEPSAQVAHIGSTALAPALTRGTVDVELGIDASRMSDLLDKLADDEAWLALSPNLQLHLRDSKSPSRHLRIRQTLADNPLLLGEFIGLQKQHVHRLGKPYPREKERFFDDLVRSAEFEATPERDFLPYRVELQSDRLELLSPLSIDAADFAAYGLENREHHEAFAGKRPDDHYALAAWRARFSAEAIKHWRRQALTLLLRRKDEGELIGTCHFFNFVWGAFRTCDLGYQIARAYEGQGYMSEACSTAIDYITSEWGVHRVQAVYDASNTRSARLAERLGLHVEGKAKDYIYMDGSWRDGVIAGRTR